MVQRHILLLDPNGGNRRNMAFLLYLAGYQVTEVADGDEALNRINLATCENQADLLLVCEGDPALDLSQLLGRLQHRRGSTLIVAAPPAAGAPRPLPPTWNSCPRHEVIETLARHWAKNYISSPPAVELVGLPSEH